MTLLHAIVELDVPPFVLLSAAFHQQPRQGRHHNGGHRRASNTPRNPSYAIVVT